MNKIPIIQDAEVVRQKVREGYSKIAVTDSGCCGSGVS